MIDRPTLLFGAVAAAIGRPAIVQRSTRLETLSDGLQASIYNATPIVLVTAAPGPAPRGLGSTGDSRLMHTVKVIGLGFALVSVVAVRKSRSKV